VRFPDFQLSFDQAPIEFESSAIKSQWSVKVQFNVQSIERVGSKQSAWQPEWQSVGSLVGNVMAGVMVAKHTEFRRSNEVVERREPPKPC
jgi:hypothetical protein